MLGKKLQATSQDKEMAALLGIPVATGRFGAMMRVELVNEGPVTIIVDSK